MDADSEFCWREHSAPPGTPYKIYHLMVQCWSVTHTHTHTHTLFNTRSILNYLPFISLLFLVAFHSLILNFTVFYHNLNSFLSLPLPPSLPDKSQRPSFPDRHTSLSLPVPQLLHWSTEDAADVGTQAIMLGAPLKTAHKLHVTLQNTYP